MTKDFIEVPVEDLRRVCDPSIFHFTNTAELPVLTDMIGQERPMRATSFGIDIKSLDYPIRQDLAVTGSVNQHGQVQAIGGVNEKIEGFFDVCAPNGLTGRQGALIPQSNGKNLRLREDVVEAVAAGKFHVYPITTLDEGIEVLTGVEAGRRNAEGNYPENTVNHAVQKRLRDLAEKVQAFSKDSNHSEPV